MGLIMLLGCLLTWGYLLYKYFNKVCSFKKGVQLFSSCLLVQLFSYLIRYVLINFTPSFNLSGWKDMHLK